MQRQASTNGKLDGEPEPPGRTSRAAQAAREHPVAAAAIDDEAFRAVFRASPAILLLLTPDFLMVEASDARLAATMTRREDVVGHSLFEVFPDNPANEDAVGQAKLRASLRRVLETKRPHTMALQRYDLRRADGTFEERWWRPQNLPILGPDGEVRYILHQVEEATAEIRLAASTSALDRQQRETRRQTALADNLLDNVPAGIIYVDADLVVRRVNPAILALHGFPAERMLGRRITEVFPDLDADWLFGPVLRRGETVRRTNVQQHHVVDGVPVVRLWDFVNTPVHGEDGQVVGVLSMALEVSERAARERLQHEKVALLEQENTHKNQFLGILSHELRTPLNAITGFGSVLQDELAGPLGAEQQRYLAKILAGAEHMLGLVNDLLDMSRIQAGKFTIAPACTALAGVIAGVEADLAAQARAKGIALRHEVAPGLPRVWADERRVAQVLANLVGNAIKFTQAGGRVEVRARAVDGFVRVEVADDGPGIAQADQADLFAPFTQVDMTATRPTGGVGLGLSICKSLVEAHGGSIGVESAAGAGATFWFTLPLHAGPDGA